MTSLGDLSIGARFRVTRGYLAEGGSSDAGVLTVAGPAREHGRVRTTDGRELHAGEPVIVYSDERAHPEHDTTAVEPDHATTEEDPH